MRERPQDVGYLLVHVAALERGQAAPIVGSLEVDGERLTLTFDDGRAAVVHVGEEYAELAAAVAGVVGTLAPPVPTPDGFPAEPLTARERWVELLEDVGGCYSFFDGICRGLRLVSIRRDGTLARIVVGDGRRTATTDVQLDDGRLVVGLPDDLATDFGSRSDA